MNAITHNFFDAATGKVDLRAWEAHDAQVALTFGRSYNTDADLMSALMDAQVGRAFLTPQLHRIESEVYQRKYPSFDFNQFMFVDTSGDMWDVGTVFYSMDKAGRAEFLSGKGFDMPYADVNWNQHTHAFHLAGIGYEWTGISFQERQAGSQAPMLYGISILVVFLSLAALYESWSIPFSVILVVPLGILGALLATKLRGLPNDVYFKVGLLTIVGLATKNAILIIEYAKDLQAEGRDLIEATLEAVHLRLRPILMTSFAFILGVMPLALSTGAGSASRNAIGTGVAGGMLAATALGIFLIPVFYVVVRRIFKAKVKKPIPSEPGIEGGKEPAV